MAKRDETPIRFDIPGPGGRRPIIPIPLNQPHWRYLRQQPMSKRDMLLSVGIGLLFWLSAVGLLTNWAANIGKSSGINVALIFAVLLFLLGMAVLFLAFRNPPKDKAEATGNPRIPQKKLPKRRKDYH
jgi:hypothetical protein